MPTISFFYGLIIRMYADDNARHHLPHFHVFYSGEEAVFTLDGELLEGNIPNKKKALIKAWATIHEEELIANWELSASGEAPFKIEPLK